MEFKYPLKFRIRSIRHWYIKKHWWDYGYLYDIWGIPKEYWEEELQSVHGCTNLIAFFKKCHKESVYKDKPPACLTYIEEDLDIFLNELCSQSMLVGSELIKTIIDIEPLSEKFKFCVDLCRHFWA